MKILKSISILLFLFATGAMHYVYAADDTVGMVLDIEGSGKISDKSGQKKLQLLTYLKRGSQINLEEGAKASLSLYATRSSYRVQGPAVIDIEADKITVIKGKAPVVKSMQEKLVVAAETSNLLTGAIRMRQLPPKILISTPENAGLIIEQKPRFSWIAVDGAQFDVALYDQSDKLIAEDKVSETNWTLPANVQLNNGGTYRWTVSFTSEKDNNLYTATGEFYVGSKKEIEDFVKLKPKDDAAIEEWILYAAMLQSIRVYHEAKALWQNLAKQRPDLDKLKELAR